MSYIEYLRQFRILDYAMFDFGLAFLFMLLLSPLLSKILLKCHIDIPKKNWIFLALPISILVHLLVGRMTPMTTRFIDPNGHYILKGTILILLVLGFQRVKRIKT